METDKSLLSIPTLRRAGNIEEVVGIGHKSISLGSQKPTNQKEYTNETKSQLTHSRAGHVTAVGGYPCRGTGTSLRAYWKWRRDLHHGCGGQHRRRQRHRIRHSDPSWSVDRCRDGPF